MNESESSVEVSHIDNLLSETFVGALITEVEPINKTKRRHSMNFPASRYPCLTDFNFADLPPSSYSCSLKKSTRLNLKFASELNSKSYKKYLIKFSNLPKNVTELISNKEEELSSPKLKLDKLFSNENPKNLRGPAHSQFNIIQTNDFNPSSNNNFSSLQLFNQRANLPVQRQYYLNYPWVTNSMRPYSNYLSYQGYYPGIQANRFETGIPSSQIIVIDYQSINWEDLIPCIPILCMEQLGCRFLQSKIDDDYNNTWLYILPAIQSILFEVMTDQFGNYLIQKIISISPRITVEYLFIAVSLFVIIIIRPRQNYLS